jgi:hypothetical protein
MASFDFIFIDDLRSSLEKDANELLLCMKAGAWKSAHILAASLIQATLIRYLASAGIGKEDDLSALSTASILEICRKEGVLSQRTVELAAFLRPYADFLSPNSRIRLSAHADETGARIAQALLEIVINEVSSHRKDAYQSSAEQIVAKLQSDPSALAILDHLLRKISRSELERLLVEALPKACFEPTTDGEPQPEAVRQRLEQSYRRAFETAPVEVRKAAANRFLYVLENESEFVVQAYESSFFRAADMKYLDGEGRSIVKSHFLASLSKHVTPALLNASEGMADYLEDEEETRTFFVPLVLSLLHQSGEAGIQAALRCIARELARLSPQNRQAITSWIGRLRWSLERESRTDDAAIIRRLEADLTRQAA